MESIPRQEYEERGTIVFCSAKDNLTEYEPQPRLRESGALHSTRYKAVKQVESRE
jgi:hypothetical protein